MKFYKVIWLILTSKDFRCSLESTVLYAINNHEEKRGSGACDVLLFRVHHWWKIRK